MRRLLRALGDKLFTATSVGSVLLLAAALVVVLGPMLYRGASAVVFRGTVEFRRMQFHEPLFARGDAGEVKRQTQAAARAREAFHAHLDRFARGIDTSAEQQQAKGVYRQLRDQLGHRVDAGTMDESDARRLARRAKRIRDDLLEAFESTDSVRVRELLAGALSEENRSALAGTAGEELLALAARYADVAEAVDLRRRGKYAAALAELQDVVYRLFGPRPGEAPRADLAQFKYGATRWDRALELREELLSKEVWVEAEEGGLRVPRRVSRAGLFDGELDEAFALVADDAVFTRMMDPRLTFYWQYFLDDCTPGHYFGGLGPELVGTLLLTLLAMVFAVPVGIATAGYLVECAREGVFLRFVRVCVNTLAGVPSIVFGLFGLAVFVLTLQPALGLAPQSSVLAGALTLAVLVLPIVIRSSEEAIRAVPPSYKEAALSLGAGGLRTFLTVTLPAALPGILTGVILSMSRAAGETAPILFTAAVAYRLGVPDSLLAGGTRALSYGSYDIAVGDRVAMDVPHQQYGMITTLILVVLVLNVAAIALRGRSARKLRGQ